MTINKAMKNYINQIKFIFYAYLGLVFFLYVRPITILTKIDSTTGFDISMPSHFITFFFLGLIAQYLNGNDSKFIFGVSLSLIVSLFIEFTHFFLPYRSFEIADGFSNILGCTSAIFIVYMYNRNK